MKVERDAAVNIKKIAKGDCFEYESDWYMQTDEDQAVCLSDGILCGTEYFVNDVYPIRLKVVRDTD